MIQKIELYYFIFKFVNTNRYKLIPIDINQYQPNFIQNVATESSFDPENRRSYAL